MPTGTVKLFLTSKGYGFIRRDSGGKDVFVHLSTVQMAGLTDLRRGQKVSFEIFDNQGKPAAKNLRIKKALGDSSEGRLMSAGFAEDARNETSSSSEDRPNGKRKPITRAALELALADAVRTRDLQCEGFVGVIVERIVPQSPGGANWGVKGVKFGRADRDRCGAVLSNCVDERQHEFEVTD